MTTSTSLIRPAFQGVTPTGFAAQFQAEVRATGKPMVNAGSWDHVHILHGSGATSGIFIDMYDFSEEIKGKIEEAGGEELVITGNNPRTFEYKVMGQGMTIAFYQVGEFEIGNFGKTFCPDEAKGGISFYYNAFQNGPREISDQAIDSIVNGGFLMIYEMFEPRMWQDFFGLELLARRPDPNFLKGEFPTAEFLRGANLFRKSGETSDLINHINIPNFTNMAHEIAKLMNAIRKTVVLEPIPGGFGGPRENLPSIIATISQLPQMLMFINGKKYQAEVRQWLDRNIYEQEFALPDAEPGSAAHQTAEAYLQAIRTAYQSAMDNPGRALF